MARAPCQETPVCVDCPSEMNSNNNLKSRNRVTAMYLIFQVSALSPVGEYMYMSRYVCLWTGFSVSWGSVIRCTVCDIHTVSFCELGFGEMGFGEMGFGEVSHSRSVVNLRLVWLPRGSLGVHVGCRHHDSRN